MTDCPYNVLVVDDEETIIKVTVETLSGEIPCPILAATSAGDALDLLQKKQVAVLLCDFQMPIMNGLELMEKAGKCSPNTVCIMITAFATKDLLIQSLNEGYIWKCIEKPWQPGHLLATVKEGLAAYLNALDASAGSPESVLQAPLPTIVDVPTSDKQPHLIIVKKAKKVSLSKKHFRHKGHIRIKAKAKKPTEHPRAKPHVPPVDKRYTELQLIRQGGNGAVYKAMDTLLNMPVAIKVLSEQAGEDESTVAQLFDEARIAMQLSHKHIVRLHTINKTEQGLCYLVMEYIDGCTFRELLEQEGSLPVDLVVNIVTICEDILGYVHRRNVYHRDLKPSNLMLSDDGLLKLIDLGLACLAARARNQDAACGTPYYISPEEVAHKPVDQRTDIYSLGIMIHEFLTGVLPFVEGMADLDALEFFPVASSGLPPATAKVLQKSFAVDPEDRWSTVHEFAVAFRQAVEA